MGFRGHDRVADDRQKRHFRPVSTLRRPQGGLISDARAPQGAPTEVASRKLPARGRSSDPVRARLRRGYCGVEPAYEPSRLAPRVSDAHDPDRTLGIHQRPRSSPTGAADWAAARRLIDLATPCALLSSVSGARANVVTLSLEMMRASM
jgi:hypothetical protein